MELLSRSQTALPDYGFLLWRGVCRQVQRLGPCPGGHSPRPVPPPCPAPSTAQQLVKAAAPGAPRDPAGQARSSQQGWTADQETWFFLNYLV